MGTGRRLKRRGWRAAAAAHTETQAQRVSDAHRPPQQLPTIAPDQQGHLREGSVDQAIIVGRRTSPSPSSATIALPSQKIALLLLLLLLKALLLQVEGAEVAEAG